MKLRNLVLGAVAAATLAFLPGPLTAQGPPRAGYGQQSWDAPPSQFKRDIERRGFRDGIEGARKDYGNHRRPDVNNRDEYKHPNVPGRDRHAYREAFRRGYNVGVQHLMNGNMRR
jgi:hypothetical protein